MILRLLGPYRARFGAGVVLFTEYRVSPNFLLCWGWVVVEVELGCDNEYKLGKYVKNGGDRHSLGEGGYKHSSEGVQTFMRE